MLQLPKRTLLVALAWIEAHCVVPDQENRGNPFMLTDEQATFLGHHYIVRADAAPRPDGTMRGEAFEYRRSQLVRAQKWGKSPLIAAAVCLEAVGPALFLGWAEGGEVYRCDMHGCLCGWSYEYLPGEAMGRPWPSALIQITATSEEQTDNTYDALRPMIGLGPLSELIPRTGEEFIRLPNDGRIDTVTSKATSRLGQRVTFVPQDETGLWVASNGGHKLARTQRRGLSGMRGRSMETTNAWNPAEESVAQQTFETRAPDVYKDFRQPPSHLSFKNKRERRKIIEFNYEGAPWVAPDAIEAEAFELMEKDAADAERFFGNRIVAGEGTWMNEQKWRAKAQPRKVEPGTRVTLGFDGSTDDDTTSIRLETLDGYQWTPTYGAAGREARWDPRDWGGKIPRLEVRAAFDEIVATYDVVRAYLDPRLWETEIDQLAADYGDKVFIKWATYRPNPMWYALERFRTDVYNADSAFCHDGNEGVTEHVRNAVIRARGIDPESGAKKYILGKPSEAQKIDDAMSAVLAHEAACDAIAAGMNAPASTNYIYY